MVNFLYTSDFITMNPIDLSCKVTSTTSNEVSPPYHQTGIKTNFITYVLYQNRLIKIPTGLRLKQPNIYLYNELITVPSGINLQISKVHLWDYTKSPAKIFNRNFVPANTPISSTSMQELNICTHCWQTVTGNVLMHKTVHNWILIGF